MRITDFHTHAFVDSLAERAMSGLEKTSGISPSTDGTVRGLESLMKRCGISTAMLLPIATKPTQQTSINNWAAELNHGHFRCCGSVHPDADDAIQEVERISRLGLWGLKFHSEYQYFRPDEERMFPIYRKAAELGLIVVFHGGWDPFGKGEILATPRSFANIAEKFPELKIVAAHMGGMNLFDEVEDCIAGKYGNIWLDTAVVANYISDEQLYRIISAHGAERILFGSDAPWDDPINEIKQLERLPLSENELELIFHGNADSLTGISS